MAGVAVDHERTTFSHSAFVLALCRRYDIARRMSRASSHALKHPPVKAPSEPAGALPDPAKDFPAKDFPELAVAIEKGRRRGRGTTSNASGRYEAEARVAFDD